MDFRQAEIARHRQLPGGPDRVASNARDGRNAELRDRLNRLTPDIGGLLAFLSGRWRLYAEAGTVGDEHDGVWNVNALPNLSAQVEEMLSRP